MGLTTSKGRDNDDLIDKLIEQSLIVTERVERAMRLVDRGRYFLPNDIEMAYKDIAWRTELEGAVKLHLSAPCIYANALEYLELKEGNSFLNVGSGTGFLSTIVGYLIGSSGINHGIEIHESLCEYARKRVDETVKLAQTQCFDWAPPEFSCGNGLALSSSHLGQYDRVYCGAAVPSSHKRALWELLKIGGVLVMPYEDQLQQVRRKTMEEFEVRIVSSVSFSDFILPDEDNSSESFAPQMRRIFTLQRLCCMVIRKAIRETMHDEFPIHIRSVVSECPQTRRHTRPVIFRENINDISVEHNDHRQFLELIGNPIDLVDEVQSDSNSSSDEEGETDSEVERVRRFRWRHPLWAQRVGARFSRVVNDHRAWRRNRRVEGDQVTTEVELNPGRNSQPTLATEEQSDLVVVETVPSNTNDFSFDTSDKDSIPERNADSVIPEEGDRKVDSPLCVVGRSGKRSRKTLDGEASEAKRRSGFSTEGNEVSDRTRSTRNLLFPSSPTEHNGSEEMKSRKSGTGNNSNLSLLDSNEKCSEAKANSSGTLTVCSQDAESNDEPNKSIGDRTSNSFDNEDVENFKSSQDTEERECQNVEDMFLHGREEGQLNSSVDTEGLEKNYKSDDQQEKKEAARLEDCQKQRDDILKFAAEFERRVDLLPISKPLIKMVKYFSRTY